MHFYGNSITTEKIALKNAFFIEYSIKKAKVSNKRGTSMHLEGPKMNSF